MESGCIEGQLQDSTDVVDFPFRGALRMVDTVLRSDVRSPPLAG